MNKSIYKLFIGVLLVSSVFQSCFDDLNTVPLDEDIVTSAVVYDDPNSYRQVLAKLYAGLAVSGQQGPAGDSDIAGIDEGFGQYLRGYWYHQELSTDEALISWNDQTIKDFHEQDWDADDGFIAAFYARIFYQISLTNEFLRETTDEKLTGRGVDGALKSEVAVFRAEARFLRALSYWHALDLFRNVPFVTEEQSVGAFFPDQTTGDALYDFIESELKVIESELIPARQNEYGRADQGAAQTLLAKLYLNSEVYIGQSKYAECIEYCEKVLNAGYSLEPEFNKLFMADNGGNDEFIFTINFDGVNTRTWGGTTFIIHGTIGGPMNPGDYGVDAGWGGTKTTAAIVDKFPSIGVGSVLVEADHSNGTYPVLYVPGGYQGWDPANAETVIKSINSDGIYESYIYFSEAAEFKFTDGPGWDVNYGDSDGDGVLEQDGGNLSVSDPGVYRVAVDFPNLTYTVEAVNFGLIGSSTVNGWDSDMDMTFDPEEEAWVISADLTQGEIKFRANDDWAINFGDFGPDAKLDQNGDNIQIPAAGFYTIKMFLGSPDYTYSIEQPSFDGRAMFYSQDQDKEITNISTMFNDNEGFPVLKFTNIRSDGSVGSDFTFVDTDFPVFRLADIHLMYAEAVLRGGGNNGRALDLFNAVRSRAYGGSGGSVTAGELDLNMILDERARELMWECHRRTDLIRFGQFTDGSYMWPWKGGVPEGKAVSSNFNLYPIPTTDIGANPNLTQNPGY